MAKFIAYEKLSKKEQKKLNAEKRKTWGDIKPITKVKPSAKLYNRKNKQDLPNGKSCFCFLYTLLEITLHLDIPQELPTPRHSLQNQDRRFDLHSLMQ